MFTYISLPDLIWLHQYNLKHYPFSLFLIPTTTTLFLLSLTTEKTTPRLTQNLVHLLKYQICIAEKLFSRKTTINYQANSKHHLVPLETTASLVPQFRTIPTYWPIEANRLATISTCGASEVAVHLPIRVRIVGEVTL